jgi:SpoVK/Ycf46/Vps4 family AAA+-type ATPase
MSDNELDEVNIPAEELVQLVRLLAHNPVPGSQAFLRRLARKYRTTSPLIADTIVASLRGGPLRSATRGDVLDHPVDIESRLPLVREENPVIILNSPIVEAEVRFLLDQLVEEHKSSDRLLEAGLAPTRTSLFVGEPGVGKTLAARWIASQLDLPLLTLDLSAVMSSFLGKTGVNLRRVLEYARSIPCVLLVDELDAVAKRRDDSSDIGELKRLVTVLLQEIDSWPEGSLLIAATNHSELLDPAVWRRFESVIHFGRPGHDALTRGLRAFMQEDIPADALKVLASLYSGETLSTVERDVTRARRSAAMRGTTPLESMLAGAKDRFAHMPAGERGKAAARLLEISGMSQRTVHEITGVSRDTIRKYAAQPEEIESA